MLDHKWRQVLEEETSVSEEETSFSQSQEETSVRRGNKC